jgi:putative spermidine/putrescine transport system ATP-binding protein/spermidine/putrescine transport system ATP-binding protein
VAAQIYQGSHIDLYVDAAEAASGRVLVRVPGSEGMARWPAGSCIGITLAADKAIAFGPDRDAS